MAIQGMALLTSGPMTVSASAEMLAATSRIGGTVTYLDGRGVANVDVDVFAALPTGARADYLDSTSTNGSGRYGFDVADGCYVIVVIAPDSGAIVGGGGYWQRLVCVQAGRPAEGQIPTELDAIVGSVNRGQLGGRISDQGGASSTSVQVELFLADGDGGRGPFVGSQTTDSGGRFSFDVSPACYVLVMVAPEGRHFVESGPFLARPVCAEAYEINTSVDSLIAGSDQPPAVLNPVELEIVRLTNELRANPTGPLARRKPMPACVSEPFYDLTIDPGTGHPRPVPAVAVDESVSVEMARVWATGMQTSGTFSHRTSASQKDLYRRLGLSVSAWGENIAWLSDYDPALAARIHFEGWRESDSGHYCSLMTPRFTHVGVGEHRLGVRSWAVQNFYHER